MAFDKELTPLDMWQCLMQYDTYMEFKYCVIDKETARRHGRPTRPVRIDRELTRGDFIELD